MAVPAVSGSAGVLLGIYPESSTPPPSAPALAVLSVKADEVKANKRGLRIERFRLLSLARNIFVNAGIAKGLMYPHNFHRTAKCCYIPHGDIQVHHAAQHGSAFYSGLKTCGSVWTCTVCSTKIQERRREEIAQGIDWIWANGYQPIMITFTFPHRAWHKISALLEKQAIAFEVLRSGGRFTNFKIKFDYQGLIRSLEIMHGDHGFHPHTHEIWIVKRDPEGIENVNSVAREIQAKVLQMWEASCIKSGLLDPSDAKSVEAFRLHAVDVKGNCSTSDYLAKQDDSRNWGVDREMAKGANKDGKLKGVHPFGLLNRDDLRSRRLFLAYALAIKGKAQIYWSPGLKKRVGLYEKTDEALAEEQREEADLLGQIEYSDWKHVRRNELRGQLLTAAEKGGWPAVMTLIESIRVAPRVIARLTDWIDADGVIHSLPEFTPSGVRTSEPLSTA